MCTYDALDGHERPCSTTHADVSRETLGDLHAAVVEQVEIAAKYSGYIDRQKTRWSGRPITRS